MAIRELVISSHFASLVAAQMDFYSQLGPCCWRKATTWDSVRPLVSDTPKCFRISEIGLLKAFSMLATYI